MLCASIFFGNPLYCFDISNPCAFLSSLLFSVSLQRYCMTSSVIYFKISQFHSLIVDFYYITCIGIDFDLWIYTVVYPSADSC